MKRILVSLAITFLAFSSYAVHPVLAQSDNPPPGSLGEVRGTILNRNSGEVVAQSLEVMLHVLDKDLAEKDLKQIQSEPDGTFVFADIPFDENLQFAAMAIYDGVTYFSDVVTPDLTSLKVEIEVPVYESTSDLSTVQIDQMHVLFDIAEGGLVIKEIYAFSNTGEHTVKNAYELGKDPQSGTSQFATLEFPLPDDANYVSFSPEEEGRFIQLKGGFADTAPIIPGDQASQIMVSYLVPYSGNRTYTYTAPLNITMVNFLVPDQAGISLEGPALMEPKPMQLQNGESYFVYSYAALNAGQTVTLSVSEKAKATAQSSSKNTKVPIALVVTFLGFLVIGAGIWWLRRPDDVDEELEDRPEAEMDLDQVINEIAQLDEAHENGEIGEEEYQQSREALRQRAKTLMEQEDGK